MVVIVGPGPLTVCVVVNVMVFVTGMVLVTVKEFVSVEELVIVMVETLGGAIDWPTKYAPPPAIMPTTITAAAAIAGETADLERFTTIWCELCLITLEFASRF